MLGNRDIAVVVQDVLQRRIRDRLRITERRELRDAGRDLIDRYGDGRPIELIVERRRPRPVEQRGVVGVRVGDELGHRGVQPGRIVAAAKRGSRHVVVSELKVRERVR
jgi:hypothetical protein